MEGRERVERVLATRAAALARPPADDADRMLLECVVVVIGAQQLAVPTVRAVQVAPPAPLARLPDAGTALLGVRIVGGDLVPVADLALLLGVESTVPLAARWTVVLGAPAVLGLLVDDVDGMVDLPAVEPTTARTGQEQLEFVTGFVGDALLLLDVDAVLTSPATTLHRQGGT